MLDKRSYLHYLYAVVFLLLLWYIASLSLKLPFIPSPFIVFANTAQSFPGTISVHALYSLWRISAGLLLSVMVGVPVGLAMGYSNRWDRLLSPVIYFLYPIPKIALIPIIMLFFGLGDLSKIFMITLIVIFQIIVASRDAAKNIPKQTFHALVSLGANQFQILQKVIVPASLPGLLTSIRVSLGTALSVLFFTETFGTQYGMGFFIMDAWMRVSYIDMYSGILILSVIGFLLFLAVDLMEKVICPWKY